MIVINTMLYGKRDPAIKKDVMSIAGDKAREEFGLMKSTFESLKQMDAKSKTVPMDLSLLHDHNTYVKWNDDGLWRIGRKSVQKERATRRTGMTASPIALRPLLRPSKPLMPLREKATAKARQAKEWANATSARGKARTAAKGNHPARAEATEESTEHAPRAGSASTAGSGVT